MPHINEVVKVQIPVKGGRLLELPKGQVELLRACYGAPKIYRLLCDAGEGFEQGGLFVPHRRQNLFAYQANLFMAEASCRHAVNTYEGKGFGVPGELRLLRKIISTNLTLLDEVYASAGTFTKKQRDRMTRLFQESIERYARAQEERKQRLRLTVEQIMLEIGDPEVDPVELQDRFQDVNRVSQELLEHFTSIVQVLDKRRILLTRFIVGYEQVIEDLYIRVMALVDQLDDYAEGSIPSGSSHAKMEAIFEEWVDRFGGVKDRPYLNGARRCKVDLETGLEALRQRDYAGARDELKKVAVWLELALLYGVFCRLTNDLSFLAKQPDLDERMARAFAGRIRRFSDRLACVDDSGFENPVVEAWRATCENAIEMLDPQHQIHGKYGAHYRAETAKNLLRSVNPKF